MHNLKELSEDEPSQRYVILTTYLGTHQVRLSVPSTEARLHIFKMEGTFRFELNL